VQYIHIIELHMAIIWCCQKKLWIRGKTQRSDRHCMTCNRIEFLNFIHCVLKSVYIYIYIERERERERERACVRRALERLASTTSGMWSIEIWVYHLLSLYYKSQLLLANCTYRLKETEKNYSYEYITFKGGHYTSSFLLLKHNILETGFCLCLQMEPTQLGPR
jgi:hypothetical protein